jgi:hypothetical protein
MRLSADDIEAAIATVAANQPAGELLNFNQVAVLLNERLADLLIGGPSVANIGSTDASPARHVAPAGRCRICGCTMWNACVIERDDGYPPLTCAWADPSHTLVHQSLLPRPRQSSSGGMNEHRVEWPLGDGTGQEAAAADPSPPNFYEEMARVMASPAIAAFARKRTAHMLVCGHTRESDLTKPPGYIARQARGTLTSFTDIVGPNRMNMPPGRRADCLKLVEAAGAKLIALWERLQVEVDEE